MARDLDIIIFGATGVTGKSAIPIVSKFSKINNRSLIWGVAGRSEQKLRDALKECEAEIGTSANDVPVIVADVEDEKSLNVMAAKTRLVINCCGPYRFFGEPVVKACIEQGTHHVDVSGEPQYMEKMQLEYHERAREKGVYVISACGFDSIPTDLGVVFLQQNFSGTLNSVDTYLSSWQEGDPLPGPSVNFGTWESAIYGLAHADELRGLRTKLYPERLPTFKPKLKAKKWPFRSDLVEGWAFPFLGSDRSVVRRSQRCFYDIEKKRPVQIETYFTIKSYFAMGLLMVFGLLFSILARFSFGRSLLLKYPEFFSFGFFSRKPPSKEKTEKTLFSITLHGEGWKEPLSSADDQFSTPPDRVISAKVKGRNPAYGATCICLVLAGITILTETDKMPSGGGVFPPGYAFAKTSLIKQLDANGVNFEVLYEKDLNVPAKY